jgi:hypothetical protein
VRRLFCALVLAATGAAWAGAALPLGEDSLAQIRARHAGRPLVLHIWGMTCGPCVAELSNWGALQRQRPAMQLVLLQADQVPAGASEPVLARAGLGRVEHWAAVSELDEFLRASIDREWTGELPRTLLIAADGKVTRLRGVADLGQVRLWLDAQTAARR